jgi:hypothetical protein
MEERVDAIEWKDLEVAADTLEVHKKLQLEGIAVAFAGREFFHHLACYIIS